MTIERRSFLTAALGLLAAPLSLFRKKPEEKWAVRVKDSSVADEQCCIKGRVFGIDYWCDCPGCETERASAFLSYLGRVSKDNVKAKQEKLT